MAWGWLSIFAPSVVGLAGIYGTLRGTTKQIQAQKDSAREERQETRLEAAYMELLGKVGQADDWAYHLLMRWGTNALKTDQVFPMRPEIFVRTLSAQGNLSVYWSDRIRQLVAELRRHIEDAYTAYVQNQSMMEGRRSGGDPEGDPAALLATFSAAKEEISRVDHVIREQVAAELSHKHDGHAEP